MAVVVAVLAALALVVLAAELLARAALRARLAHRCASVLGAVPTVTLAARPVLPQLALRRLSVVGVQTRTVGAGPEAILLDAHARDVAPVADGLRLGALAATATLRLSWIRHVVDAAQGGGGPGGIAVRSVALLPRRKSLAMTVALPVAFGLGVDLRVVVAVRVKGGRLAFRATDLSMPVSIVPVPIPVAWAVDAWVKELRPQVVPAALDALHISRMRWEKDAVTLELSAEEVTVPLG